MLSTGRSGFGLGASHDTIRSHNLGGKVSEVFQRWYVGPSALFPGFCLTHNGKDGSRWSRSSTILKISILWSGVDGPQATIASSLLASQHVAVIFDAALPTLWPILRRFLILAFRPGQWFREKGKGKYLDCKSSHQMRYWRLSSLFAPVTHLLGLAHQVKNSIPGRCKLRFDSHCSSPCGQCTLGTPYSIGYLRNRIRSGL